MKWRFSAALLGVMLIGFAVAGIVTDGFAADPIAANRPASGSEPNAAELSPFSTDGCSAFPNGSLKNQQLWRDCCVAHDLAYWAGGTYEDRSAADEALAECVADVGEPAIAKLMLAGVRTGGSPFWPTTFRWGYGWHYLRGYQPLTDAEKELILQSIDAAPAEAFVPKTAYWYLAPLPKTTINASALDRINK
ncbi:hypothetical protein [Permianibacter fluminis]|uniref:hypothetical protein n=1 Tax=Permianibacter fluminis TaxID=2738515 RepID=UPI001B7D8C65|nr:hypothetical protein [Permianibacter fluminis]